MEREPTVMPSSNVGTFKSANQVTPTLWSFAMEEDQTKVPVLNNRGKVDTSRAPNFPVLSPNSLLTVYFANHKVAGLPTHKEQVCRRDLELPMLMRIVERDLNALGWEGRLIIVVTDFLVTSSQSATWHTSKITEIMDLVKKHPKGNIIRFGQSFMTPDLIKLPN